MEFIKKRNGYLPQFDLTRAIEKSRILKKLGLLILVMIEQAGMRNIVEER